MRMSKGRGVTAGVLLLLLAAAAAIQAREQIVARVNKTKLTLEEFNGAISPGGRSPRGTMTTEFKQMMLDRWIDSELLYQEAVRRKIHRSEEVKKQMDDLKRRVKEMERSVVLQAFTQGEMEEIKQPTDEEVKKHYEDNMDKFNIPERVMLSLIMVKTEDEAQAAIKRLKDGEDFAAVASEISTEPSTKRRGGNMGNVDRARLGRFGPEVSAAAFALKSGAISDPIVSSTGSVYVLKPGEKTPAVQKTFEQASQQARSFLLMESQKAHYDALLSGLREKAKIEKHPELLKAKDEAGER